MRAIHAWTTVAVLLLAASQGQASIILVNPPGDDSQFNFWPLATSDMTWQQVYDASFFGASPLSIDAFSFIAQTSGSVSYGADFAVHMSTTSVAPGAMSTTFASNVGGDETLVLSGPIAISATAGNLITFTLTTPFAFDPTQGNLLIQINHLTALSGGIIYSKAYQSTPAGLQRIADQTTGPTGTDYGFGELVTQFDVSGVPEVPEPASVTLFTLGAIGAMAAARRRRQAA